MGRRPLATRVATSRAVTGSRYILVHRSRTFLASSHSQNRRGTFPMARRARRGEPGAARLQGPLEDPVDANVVQQMPARPRAPSSRTRRPRA